MRTSTILVVTDLSKQAHGALRVGQKMASEAGTLKILHVVDMLGDDNPLHVFFDSPEELNTRVQTDGLAALQEHVTSVLGPDHGATLEVKFGHPVNDIVRAAHFDSSISLIVAGTTGHGRIYNTIFGSTVGRIIRECEKPVLVVPADVDDNRVDVILAPVDMSECSQRSLKTAISLAGESGQVYAFSAFNIPPITPYFPAMPVTSTNLLTARSAKRKEAIEDWVSELGVQDRVKVLPVQNVEDIASSILDAAQEQGAGLVCMGTHGRSGVERAILGSVAERVLRQTTIPVLVTR